MPSWNQYRICRWIAHRANCGSLSSTAALMASHHQPLRCSDPFYIICFLCLAVLSSQVRFFLVQATIQLSTLWSAGLDHKDGKLKASATHKWSTSIRTILSYWRLIASASSVRLILRSFVLHLHTRSHTQLMMLACISKHHLHYWIITVYSPVSPSQLSSSRPHTTCPRPLRIMWMDPLYVESRLPWPAQGTMKSFRAWNMISRIDSW